MRCRMRGGGCGRIGNPRQRCLPFETGKDEVLSLEVLPYKLVEVGHYSVRPGCWKKLGSRRMFMLVAGQPLARNRRISWVQAAIYAKYAYLPVSFVSPI